MQRGPGPADRLILDPNLQTLRLHLGQARGFLSRRKPSLPFRCWRETERKEDQSLPSSRAAVGRPSR